MTSVDTKADILEELGIEIEPDEDSPWQVLMFNDDFHSFDEVIFQVQKARGCDLETATAITFAAHFYGQAVVKIGTLAECEKVSSVLQTIKLQTRIEKV